MLPIDELFDQQALIEKNDFTECDKWPAQNTKRQNFKILERKLKKNLIIAKGFDYSAKLAKKNSSTISCMNDMKLSFGFG